MLTLIASDHGQQPTARSGSIQLDIRIVDTSVPSFLQSVYSIDVREDAPIGTNLLRVEAASDDGGQILYELVKECPFIIDRLTGQIQLKQLLDFERDDSYRLTVKASENGIPTFAIVFVRVLDVNDNSVSIYLRVEGRSERATPDASGRQQRLPSGNTTLKQTRNNQNVLFVPEDTAIGTTLAHVILNDMDSFGKCSGEDARRVNELLHFSSACPK